MRKERQWQPLAEPEAALARWERLLEARQARQQRQARPPLPGGAVGAPIFSFTTFRLLSPVLVPMLLSIACLSLLLPLAFSSPDTLAISTDALGATFLVYAAVGVILAAALAYAPNEALWALMMLLGLLAYGAITLWAVFGPVAGLGLLVGVGSCLGMVIRARQHQVLEHTAHVMVLFGKYHRTLLPGLHLRFPGEQVLTIVHTTEVTITATMHDIILLDGRHVDAAALACCRVIAEHARDLAAHAQDWPEQVRQMLELTLHDTLSELRWADLTAQDPWAMEAGESLAVRLRGRLQLLVGGWGLHVVWVRPHDLRPLAAPSAPPEALQPPTPTTLALPLPAAPLHRAPTPQALAEAYDAVRERRITDPTTITQIATSFEAAAQDPLLGPQLPFDAAQAAQLLHQLAHSHQ